MKIYIALLRGINVGGNASLPMKSLKMILEGLDLKNVQTYIQSGNVVFECAEQNIGALTSKIQDGIEKAHGFSPNILLLDLEAFKKAASENPFPEAVQDPKSLHLSFLASTPGQPDLESLETIKKENERYQLAGKTFYLHAPDGIGQSKLAARIEKSLGVPATIRNWRTVTKILEMAERGK